MDGFADAYSAGVRVLDGDDARGLVSEFLEAVERAVRVVYIIVGKFLAVELLSRREGSGELVADLAVEGAALVRVLAVAHILRLFVGEGELFREDVAAGLFPEVGLDERVVRRGVVEDLVGELQVRVDRDFSVLAELGEDSAIVGGVDYDRDVLIVLRRRAEHRRTADVDVLDGFGSGDAGLQDSLLERVEVYRDNVDRGDAELFELRHVLGVRADGEDSGVNHRVKGLDTTVKTLREAGDIRNLSDRDARRVDDLEGSAGRENLVAKVGEPACEFLDAGLVGETDYCAFFHFDYLFYK